MWLAAALVLLAALYVPFRRLGARVVARPPAALAYRLTIRDDRLVGGPALLRAVQGDTLTLVVTSNRPGTLHVHEYEQAVVLALEPGREVSKTFALDRPGRFAVHLISPGNTHPEVAAVEVAPR